MEPAGWNPSVDVSFPCHAMPCRKSGVWTCSRTSNSMVSKQKGLAALVGILICRDCGIRVTVRGDRGTTCAILGTYETGWLVGWPEI
ncbi:hypothetical protein B0T17DRAFT_520708, partial [Bombardia bombarda]